MHDTIQLGNRYYQIVAPIEYGELEHVEVGIFEEGDKKGEEIKLEYQVMIPQKIVVDGYTIKISAYNQKYCSASQNYPMESTYPSAIKIIDQDHQVADNWTHGKHSAVLSFDDPSLEDVSAVIYVKEIPKSPLEDNQKHPIEYAIRKGCDQGLPHAHQDNEFSHITIDEDVNGEVFFLGVTQARIVRHVWEKHGNELFDWKRVVSKRLELFGPLSDHWTGTKGRHIKDQLFEKIGGRTSSQYRLKVFFPEDS